MDTNKNQVVLSCIQPTGNLHIGRYFGALRNWVELQSKYECKYGIVDYHAMTMPFVPGKLREATWELAINMAAVGINPDKIFIQSMIPEHAELAWIFNCVASYGELGRMVQFKDKSQQIASKDKDAFISAGLFTYPVLQAADILIYKADYVPVGDDQDQHIELTRNIAQRFNNIVGRDYFVLPDVLHSETPRIMSTADPMIKMSASKGEKHNINVFSDPDIIRNQIKKAVTDSVTTDGENASINSPGIANLRLILKAAYEELDQRNSRPKMYSEMKNRDVIDELLKSARYGNFKNLVAEAIVELTNPFREKREEILNDVNQFKDRIKASSEVIRAKAQTTLREVKELVGLMQSR